MLKLIRSISRGVGLIALTAISGQLCAQDIQFSQFYAASLYQNPAFAGGSHFNRASMHQRWQWVGLDATYSTSLVSFDTYLEDFNTGFGGYILRDVQGRGDISSVSASLIYAYELHINKEWAARFGLQGEFVKRSADYGGLLFPSQFDGTGLNGNNPGDGLGARKFFVDFGTGVLLYSNNLWFGASFHHLNSPNQAVVDDKAPLPLKAAFTAGYKIQYRNHRGGGAFRDHPTDFYIMPTIHYKTQASNDQFDVGIYGIYDHLLFGTWYRGIPYKTTANIPNNESIVVMMGWELKKTFDVRYSYDFTISSLNSAAGNSGGSHEVTLSLLIHENFKSKTKARRAKLSCPDHHSHY